MSNTQPSPIRSLNYKTACELVEIAISYRHELIVPQKCMQGEVNLNIASGKTRHKLKILNEKIARIDRVLKEVNL